MRSTRPQISRGFFDGSPPDFSNLIGIPYEEKNCWDIAVSFYSIVFNIELKQFYEGDTPNRSDTSNLIHSNKGEFEEVKSPRFGDIIIIRLFGIESHIAIYLGEGKMLHTSKANGCHIEKISRFEKIISGYYRVKNND